MKRTFLSTILIFLVFTYVVGQITDTSKENILAGEFNKGTYDFPEAWDNMKQVFRQLNPKEDFLAITLCSPDPLPVALNLAYFDVMESIYEITPHMLLGQDEKTGEPIFTGKDFITVPKDRILLLRRTTGCEFIKGRPITSTYWIVRPNNELPPFVEIRNIADLERYDIVSGNTYLTQPVEFGIPRISVNYDKYLLKLSPQIYKTALEKTTSFMKEHRTAIATIKIYFFGKSPSQIAVNRVLQAQKFLKESGINSSRVYIRKISLKGKGLNTSDDQKYPHISIIYDYPPMATKESKK